MGANAGKPMLSREIPRGCAPVTPASSPAAWLFLVRTHDSPRDRFCPSLLSTPRNTGRGSASFCFINCVPFRNWTPVWDRKHASTLTTPRSLITDVLVSNRRIHCPVQTASPCVRTWREGSWEKTGLRYPVTAHTEGCSIGAGLGGWF